MDESIPHLHWEKARRERVGYEDGLDSGTICAADLPRRVLYVKSGRSCVHEHLAPTYPLLVDTSLLTLGAAVQNAMINYAIYRRSDDARQFVLFEQWRDAEALNGHISRLQRVYGPPDEQEPYSPTHHRRRPPKAFLAYFDKTEAVRYDALE
jgi:hypothetical protein